MLPGVYKPFKCGIRQLVLQKLLGDRRSNPFGVKTPTCAPQLVAWGLMMDIESWYNSPTRFLHGCRLYQIGNKSSTSRWTLLSSWLAAQVSMKTEHINFYKIIGSILPKRLNVKKIMYINGRSSVYRSEACVAPTCRSIGSSPPMEASFLLVTTEWENS